ncbi:RE1 [Symbiodinium sp. CCMP2592]|nr:RE1 [Symbiodinium sp. CCMP2592]
MAQQGAQAAHVPVDDIDDDLPELEAAAGPQLPQPMPNNPFLASPAASPSQGQIVLGPAQLNALFEQLAEATRAASDAAAAAAAAATSSRDGPPTLTGKDMLRVLPKPEVFAASTREQEHTSWPGWFWSFQQYLSALDPGYGPDLEALEANPGSVIAKGQGTIAQQARSRQLYSLLAALIRGRGYMIVRQTESGHGLEALRQLMSLFAPRSQGRSLGILTAITQVPSFKPSEALLPQILDLERVFTSYEQSASETLQGSVKTALLLRCLPANTKNQIYASLPEDATYTQVREASLRIERQHFKWQSVSYFGTVREATAQRHDEATQMEIDAVQWGKPKGKGGKPQGKDKGKGKGGKKGQHAQTPHGGKPKGGKGKDQGKGGKQPGKDKGKGKGKGDKSQVECYNCGRKGHYAAECWRSKGQANVHQVVNNPTPSEAAPSTVGPSASQAASEATTAVRRIEIDLSAVGSGTGSGGIHMITQAMSAPRPDQVLLEPYTSEEVLLEPNPSEAMSAPRPGPVLLEPYPSEATSAPKPDLVPLEPFPSEFIDLVHATLPAMTVPDPLVRNFEQAAPMYDMSYSDSDGEWTFANGSLSVVTFAPEHQVCAIHQDIEIVLDSGADHSCLPAAFGSTGTSAPPLQATFRDAQGNVISPTSVRNAKLDLGPLTITETWLIGPVTTPLLSLGKLYRQGFTVGRVNNELKLFREGDEAYGVPVFMKHNSLCVRGSIRVMQSDAPQAGQAGHPPASPSEHHAPQSQTSSCEPHAPQSQTSSCEPHAPQSQSSTPQGDFHVNALTVTLHGPWLSLKAPFVQIDTGLVANKCASLCYVDCTLAFPSLPIAFRTTLHNSPRGWMLHTLNEDLSTLDDFEARFEAAFPRPKMYETITIGSTYRLDVRQLFPEHSDHPLVAVPVPEESDGDPSPDAAMDLDVNIDAGGVDLGANGGDADEGESPGAAGNAPGEKPVVVDGTELTLDCTLATLRAAAQSLGIGKSGGKATVLKRIKEFLARNDFLWANLPTDVQLPREQAPVREPSQDEVRKHSLTHMPFQAWYMTSELTRWIATLGHSEVTLRSDPEPVCLSLQKLVQAQRLRLGLRTHLEQSEPDDHAANAAEPAVETLRQLTNTLLSEFESRAGVKVASLDAMHAWAWRHASFIQQRFTRSQGQTPFELACGRPYQGKLVCIGETVYGRVKSAVKGSIRRLPQTYLRSADFAKRLRDHPYSQAAFLAGQVGQCRPQKTRDAQQAPPEPQPDESTPAGADPLPYPGYVLPDSTPLSELVPPPAIRSDFVPEPPTPMQEDSGPVTPLQPAPSDAEVVSSPLAVVPDAEVLADLTTRFVVTWRCKTIAGCTYWLRRARLVARDFAFLCPGRTDLFSPASNALQSKIIPCVFIDNYHNGWQLVSLDVTDAYLNCPQAEDTCTSVMINGERLYFKLLRLLPGQQEGSQTWFYQFTDALKVGSRVELMQEVPSLFRFQPEDGGGGGLVHVDDLLGTGPASVIKCMTDHLERDYKVTVNLISVPGQEVHFLKKRHYLLSSTELLIEVSPKHLEKLKSLCGHPKHRKSPLPSGRLPTEKEDDAPLSQDQAFRFRSAVGVLLYLQSDLPHAMHSIRHLSGFMSSPTVGAWAILRHLVGYLSATEGYCACLTAGGIGHGVQVHRPGINVIETFSDADWGGCRSTRRSVSSSVILCNSKFIHAASKTQKSIALSSAESEFGAAVSAAIDGTLVSSMMRFVSPEPTTPPLLMIDNSAARAILQRAGVGRVRHLDVKLLWTQQRVAEGLLEVLPAPTRTNVADIGTKLLGVQRTEFLLGLIGFRDSRNGYARVGDAILSTEHNVQAIRNVCKDLSKIAKGDATANTARILSVILIAMQATGSLGAEDGDDANDDDATSTILDTILESLVQIVGYASAVYEAYPSTCVAVCQCVAIAAFLMCAFMCCGRRMTDVPEASVQVRIASGVAVDVRTSRSEPKAKAGEQVRGARPKTASRPKLDDDDERAQSPGAHEVHAGRPGSSSDVLRSNSEASERSEKIPRACPIPQRRVPQTRSADGVWISTSQGYAYHKATCGKLNQSLGVTEVSRAVAEERGYRACRICKP